MKLKWSIILLACLGVGAALSAAVLVTSLHAKPIREIVPLPPPDVDILVAAKDIPAMSVVDADSIAQKTIRRAELPQSYFTEPTQIIGKLVIVSLIKEQAFTKEAFPIEGSGFHLAGMLPRGKRALTVSLSGYSGLEGLLYPGCMVDVLASFTVSSASKLGKAISTTLLQNVEVLAVENVTVLSPSEEKEGLWKQSKQLNRGLLVTLMVDSEQGEALQLGIEHGTISLAMRNPKDVDVIDRDATLLSEGRLAQLAQMLAPTVFSDKAESPSKSAAPAEAGQQPGESGDLVTQTPEDTPAQLTAPAVRQFEVAIIRGVSYETRTFPLPATER